MDKTYDPKQVEEKMYQLWEAGSPRFGYGEAGGYFTPKIDKTKKPFSILLPLPNANDPMHMGHAMFAIQDVLIRYHRMKGDPTLWLPGGDHAGIETQYVFEKKLAKEGKSRFDFDRQTLYHMIETFVEENKDINRNQMKRLGFSLDWTRYHYSLEPGIVKIVLETFHKLHDDGLAYRAERLVNYCTHCGTAYSDLEIRHVERQDPLYFMKYGPFVLATVRPETKFGDTAVAVNPKDKRYQAWVGQEIEVEGLIGKFKVKVVADSAIDPKFGTGVAKVTPAHDFTDAEIAKRHHLPTVQVIGFDGRLNDHTGPYAGLKVKAAREKVVADLQSKGLIDHIDTNYVHTVATCYRCGTVLEPLPLPQWYIKMQPLAEPAIKAVKEGKTKIAPLKRFEKMYFDWMAKILDWNISRQIVWGPRIPVWYCLDCNPKVTLSFLTSKGNKISGTYQQLKDKYSFEEIAKGLQSLSAPLEATYDLEDGPCKKCGNTDVLQETDTFDTWFLSSQWSFTTLLSQRGMTNPPAGEAGDKLQMTNWGKYKAKYPNSDFAYFYPTSILDTMWDILFFWVARMMMMGLYRTGTVPFKVIHLHSRVVDAHGQKMSKSKGNVANPIEMIDRYGADALRFALTFGAAPGSDIALSEDKIRGMRNFANKLWNIVRLANLNFAAVQVGQVPWYEPKMFGLSEKDKLIIKDLNTVVKSVTRDLERYHFSDAAQNIYEFTWHRLADIYLEENKERYKRGDLVSLSVLRHVLLNLLKLLHPFMPFITEELWNKLPRKSQEPLIISSWPK